MSSTPPSRSAVPLADRRRRHGLRTTIRWTARLVVAAWSVLLLAWLTLHWAILPRLDDWRPQIETRLTAAVGAPVRIGAIRVRSGSWVPAFELDDVRLLDPDGGVALRLGRVSAALAPRSLLALEPRFAQLLLDGVQLEVRRGRDGRVRVGGFDVDGASGAPVDPRLSEWFFSQSEFVIRRGRVRWTDETRTAPPLALDDVDLVLRNGLRRHALRIDATPPVAWGDRFALRGRFTQPLISRAGDWRRWSGQLFVDLPRADAAELRRRVDLPFELDAGRGALRAWLDIDAGRPTGGSADLALADVALRLAPELPPLQLPRLQARLDAHRDAAGWQGALAGLDFVSDDGVPWTPSALRLSLRQALPAADGTPAPVTGGALHADRLELAPLARLGARLPLPPALHDALTRLAPQGTVQALDVDWRGPPQAPQGWRLRGRVQQLALAAGPPGPPAHGAAVSPGRPGVRGAALEIDATEAGGQATLAIRQGALLLPGVFEQPEVALRSADARLAWTVGPAPVSAVAAAPAASGPAGAASAGTIGNARSAANSGNAGNGAGAAPPPLPTEAPALPVVELTVREARFVTADGRGEFSGRWRTGVGSGTGADGRFPGQLELKGTLQDVQAARVVRYLPVALPASARRYIEQSIGAGRLSDGRFEVAGDLWHFPFTDGSPGRFMIQSRVQQLQFAAVPPVDGQAAPWPPMSDVAGELEFDRGAMRIRAAKAQIAGLALRDVRGGIDDLVHAPVLRLDGQARGAAADLLRFVDATPVGGWIGGVLARASATGAAELTLSLALPLHDPAAGTVRGAVQLAGNDVRVSPALPTLAAARGRVEFDRHGFTVVGGRARVFGGDATFEGGSQADGSVRFSGQGLATAEGLLRPGELPGLTPGLAAFVARRVSGQAPYRVQLTLPPGGRPAELQLGSSLAGLAIDLPAPFTKPAGTAWPLNVQAGALGARDGSERWRVEVGEVLQARFEREPAAGEADRPRRGSVGIGTAPPPLPARGVVVALQAPRIDVDAWQALADAMPAARSPVPTGASPAADDDAWPSQLTLRSDELRWGAQRLHGLTLALQRRAAPADTTWIGELQSTEAAGRVEWRQPRDGTPGRVSARLERLALPAADEAPPAGRVPSEGAGEAAKPAAPTGAASLPALDVVVQDFRWRGKALGRLEARAENRPGPAPAPAAPRSGGAGAREPAGAAAKGPAPEWQLDQLRLTSPDAILEARGRWIGGRRVALDVALDLNDSGRFAERIGAGSGLRGGRGRIDGTLGWDGSPLAPEVGRLDGQLKIALAEGRFLNAEPGAARLLGVLSLQALPRRLLLDFRDVFQEGFGFDKVTGDVALDNGVARTSNLRLLGLQAAVLIEGRTDLRRETQDLRIVAVPQIDAGTASLAYAAINPAIGLGAFLAQWLLREPMMAAGTREFRVTGQWSDPKVERVERVAAAPAASTGRPASAPSPGAAGASTQGGTP